ncbi:hypothetical protein Fcan01_02708 [Folsomia candida]|uniref:Uncharacterized protein n=1 Tax=Folsomia candida TaxID=158441 RepID=A0A226EZM3_FOLCA|nr:hypothetical protein Fcan01_02708 [Folsomia candida]
MAEENRPTSVSQTIDDDECGSFIVVHRWSNDPAEVVGDKQQKLDKLDEHHQEQLDDGEEGDEQFSDAAADLGSSETLVSPNLMMSIEDQQRQAGDGPSHEPDPIEKTASTTEPPISSLMAASQEGAMMMQDDERFSMTNYSTVSSNSDQQELQELQAKLTQVISDHRCLYELLEKQNLELEQRKITIEELKLLANESVLREKEKSEVSRKIVEKMTAERDLAIQELHARIAASSDSSGFEALETLESQLKQREQILKQNDEQIKELSTRLHQEIIRREELAQLLQMKEDEDRIKRDSLSSSDEALAKSLSERERMEQILEEAMKSKRELQQETVTLKQQLEITTADNTRLQTICQKLETRFAEGDADNREMRIKLAALEAETERQAHEKSTLLQELQGVTEMLQVRTTELREIREQTHQQAGGNSSMTGSIAGNLFGGIGGLFKKPSKPTNATGARFYGMRDANDDPNEPFHDVGAQATHAISPGNQCPICLKRFDNLQKLEYHASNCGVESAMNTDPFVFP